MCQPGRGWRVGVEVEYLGLSWKQRRKLTVKTELEGQGPGEKVRV